MATFIVILSCLLWALSLVLLFYRQLIAPAASYIALFLLSFARSGPYPLLPINNTILIGWLCMTLVVMAATIIQNREVTADRRGVGYMLGGGIVGLAIGLLGFTATASVTTMYSLMVLSVACGVFFAFLLFSNTPAGRPFGFRSGRFFQYLLAKGFPIAVTLMMAGVPLTIVVAGNSL